jgi:hypothetical protein
MVGGRRKQNSNDDTYGAMTTFTDDDIYGAMTTLTER